MANSKMVRSKKEWVCKNCGTTTIAWSGICKNCGSIGVIEEHILIPPKPKATLTQRGIMSRSKRTERKAARRMVEIDGPDPNFQKIASSTGRVGHITNLQFDAVSKNYATEIKNRKIPTWMVKAWIQIQQRAIDFNKNALLYMEPPNMPKTFPLNGQNHKSSDLVIITQARHEELILAEKELNAIQRGR
jgi:hypothetical protein